MLAPNPERSDRLWASEVGLEQPSAVAAQMPGRKPVGKAEGKAEGGGVMGGVMGGVGGGAGAGSGACAAQAASPPKPSLSPADTRRPGWPHPTGTAPGADEQPPGGTASVGGAAGRGGYLPGRRLYVGNLPADAGWRDLSGLFSAFGELLHLQARERLEIEASRRNSSEAELPAAPRSAILPLPSYEAPANPHPPSPPWILSHSVLPTLPPRPLPLEVSKDPSPTCQHPTPALPPTPVPLSHQVPLDPRGRPRGFGVVELSTPDAAAAALRSLAGGVDLRGSRLLVRDDTALVMAAGSSTVFVGNLAATVEVQALKEHLRISRGAVQVGEIGVGLRGWLDFEKSTQSSHTHTGGGSAESGSDGQSRPRRDPWALCVLLPILPQRHARAGAVKAPGRRGVSSQIRSHLLPGICTSASISNRKMDSDTLGRPPFLASRR